MPSSHVLRAGPCSHVPCRPCLCPDPASQPCPRPTCFVLALVHMCHVAHAFVPAHAFIPVHTRLSSTPASLFTCPSSHEEFVTDYEYEEEVDPAVQDDLCAGHNNLTALEGTKPKQTCLASCIVTGTRIACSAHMNVGRTDAHAHATALKTYFCYDVCPATFMHLAIHHCQGIHSPLWLTCTDLHCVPPAPSHCSRHAFVQAAPPPLHAFVLVHAAPLTMSSSNCHHCHMHVTCALLCHISCLAPINAIHHSSPRPLF